MFYLDKLEFNTIQKKLASFACTVYGKDLSLNLDPSPIKSKVENMLEETKEALYASSLKGNFPISEIEIVIFSASIPSIPNQSSTYFFYFFIAFSHI